MAKHKSRMPHPGHNKHLCYLMNVGYSAQEPQGYKDMVRGAKFICKSCGRAAAKKTSLCQPVKL